MTGFKTGFPGFPVINFNKIKDRQHLIKSFLAGVQKLIQVYWHENNLSEKMLLIPIDRVKKVKTLDS